MNRVDRLKTLITEHFNGSQKAFAQAVSKSPAQVSHWLSGVRGIGDGVRMAGWKREPWRCICGRYLRTAPRLYPL